MRLELSGPTSSAHGNEQNSRHWHSWSRLDLSFLHLTSQYLDTHSRTTLEPCALHYSTSLLRFTNNTIIPHSITTTSTSPIMSSSVNVPTNPKIKEQDVNAKLQLYGIYSGMLSPNSLFAGTIALVAITDHQANTRLQPLPMARSLRSVPSRSS